MDCISVCSWTQGFRLVYTSMKHGLFAAMDANISSVAIITYSGSLLPLHDIFLLPVLNGGTRETRNLLFRDSKISLGYSDRELGSCKGKYQVGIV
ncbi:hypothetical protein R9C00_12200 [Flammeovirgaceae bacterium SG7u.111]|nr:hypothetical protein [Flammeovirgaceae bacterium SG7u.132]WPO38215.1 hypothetical protein R9C00_12200 [Flammeovirgaceae bacterium SG7u.111]